MDEDETLLDHSRLHLAETAPGFPLHNLAVVKAVSAPAVGHCFMSAQMLAEFSHSNPSTPNVSEVDQNCQFSGHRNPKPPLISISSPQKGHSGHAAFGPAPLYASPIPLCAPQGSPWGFWEICMCPECFQSLAALLEMWHLGLPWWTRSPFMPLGLYLIPTSLSPFEEAPAFP